MSVAEAASSHGLYLAVDGPDGVGKSTLVAYAKEALAGVGRSVVVRAEPERDGPLWPAIRDHRLSGEYPDEVWSLVLAAASIAAQRRPGGTLNLRAAGIWVVTDRSPLSVLAHYWQSVAPGLLKALISRFVPPDLLIFLRPESPELLRRRLRNRGESEENIEQTIATWKNYGQAAGWLVQLGWPVATLDVAADATTGALWRAAHDRIPVW